MWEVTFAIYYELFGEGNPMACMKFSIRTGPTRELRPKPSHSEKRPVPSSGTYIGCDDE